MKFEGALGYVNKLDFIKYLYRQIDNAFRKDEFEPSTPFAIAYGIKGVYMNDLDDDILTSPLVIIQSRDLVELVAVRKLADTWYDQIEDDETEDDETDDYETVDYVTVHYETSDDETSDDETEDDETEDDETEDDETEDDEESDKDQQIRLKMKEIKKRYLIENGMSEETYNVFEEQNVQ